MLESSLMFFEKNWYFALVAFCCYVAARGFWDWCRDLAFYKKNGWNFNEDSGVSLRQALAGSQLVPNKLRVCCSWPAFIVVWAIAGLIVLVLH